MGKRRLISMAKRKHVIRCAFCNKPLKEAWRAAEPVCAHCEAKGRRWDEELPLPPVPVSPVDEDEDEEEEEEDFDEKLESRRRRQSHRHMPFFLGLGIVLVLWAGLFGLSFALSGAAYALCIVGVIVFLVGMVQLFHSAADDGFSLSAFVSRNPFILVFLFLIQAAAAPVFSVVYLFINFEDAWKPALLQVVGIAMTASGVLLLRFVL
jgi:hypothetical protein